MSIVYRRVADLKPDSLKPRHHSKKQIRQIAKSIDTFGFVVPVLVDADLNVISGHGRLLACLEPGITEVPTVRLDHLAPEQVRSQDNRQPADRDRHLGRPAAGRTAQRTLAS